MYVYRSFTSISPTALCLTLLAATASLTYEPTWVLWSNVCASWIRGRVAFSFCSPSLRSLSLCFTKCHREPLTLSLSRNSNSSNIYSPIEPYALSKTSLLSTKDTCKWQTFQFLSTKSLVLTYWLSRQVAYASPSLIIAHTRTGSICLGILFWCFFWVLFHHFDKLNYFPVTITYTGNFFLLICRFKWLFSIDLNKWIKYVPINLFNIERNYSFDSNK